MAPLDPAAGELPSCGAELLEILRRKFPGASGDWLTGLALEVRGPRVNITFAHAYFGRWFALRKKVPFENALREIFGDPEIIYLDHGEHKDARKEQADGGEGEGGDPAAPQKGAKRSRRAARGDPFAAFLANEKNALPVAAARSCARGEAGAPLLLFCGASGVGKTFLLKIILAAASACGRVAVLHAADAFFGDEFPACETSWRGRDMLLIDDIQLALSKPAWQEKLAALADDASSEPGRRLVLALHGDAAAAGRFEARLASRLEGGIIAELAPPDLDVRLRCLENLARGKKISLDKEQALLLARRAQGFRQIRGLIEKAALWQAEKNADPAAFDALLQGAAPKGATFGEIIALAARSFSVAADDILGQSRKPATVLARQAAMYLCRKKFGLSYPELGKAFGRDHSTVIHAVRKIEEAARTDKVLHNALLEMEIAAS